MLESLSSLESTRVSPDERRDLVRHLFLLPNLTTTTISTSCSPPQNRTNTTQTRNTGPSSPLDAHKRRPVASPQRPSLPSITALPEAVWPPPLANPPTPSFPATAETTLLTSLTCPHNSTFERIRQCHSLCPEIRPPKRGRVSLRGIEPWTRRRRSLPLCCEFALDPFWHLFFPIFFPLSVSTSTPSLVLCSRHPTLAFYHYHFEFFPSASDQTHQISFLHPPLMYVSYYFTPCSPSRTAHSGGQPAMAAHDGHTTSPIPRAYKRGTGSNPRCCA